VRAPVAPADWLRVTLTRLRRDVDELQRGQQAPTAVASPFRLGDAILTVSRDSESGLLTILVRDAVTGAEQVIVMSS
jgi:hypothetical protein